MPNPRYVASLRGKYGSSKLGRPPTPVTAPVDRHWRPRTRWASHGIVTTWACAASFVWHGLSEHVGAVAYQPVPPCSIRHPVAQKTAPGRDPAAYDRTHGRDRVEPTKVSRSGEEHYPVDAAVSTSRIRHALRCLDSSLLRVGAFVIPAFILVALANSVMASFDFPEYGTWTGLRAFEAKLRKLDAFARQGPVDAVVLGSSVADMGFSAERYGELASSQLGRPYRAFNLATGGAEVMTFPKLYRLMRTVAHPRTVLLVLPSGIRRSNQAAIDGPDYFLDQAPVHRTLRPQWLLDLDHLLWSMPLIHDASPARDELLYGKFVHLPGEGVDLYRAGPLGDRTGYTYETTAADLAHYREIYETQAPPMKDGSTKSIQEQLAYYFDLPDIDAMSELRTVAESDGIELIVVAHAPASTMVGSPSSYAQYLLQRHDYFSLLSTAVGARLVYALDDFSVPSFAVTDSTHLNHYGAVIYTEHVAADVLGTGAPRSPASFDATWLIGDIDKGHSSTDPSFGPFSALIARASPTSGSVLELHYLHNHAIPPMPDGLLQVALRLPDGRDLIAPARAVGGNRTVLRVSFPDLPKQPRQVFIVRLVQEAGGRLAALNQPLDDYRWIVS